MEMLEEAWSAYGPFTRPSSKLEVFIDDYGSADASFTVQEIHIGMAADLGSLQRLPKIVPPGVAREMAFTGERD